MDPEKPKFNWQRMLITSGIVLFAALVVGGTTWYVMDKSAREIKTANDASTATMQKQISTLETKVAADTKTVTETTPAASSAVSTLKEYCKTVNNGIALVGYSYMETANGEYGNCGIGDGVSPGGAMLIAKYVDGAWTKLWVGNGVIDASVCDKDKIPNKMSGGTCNY